MKKIIVGIFLLMCTGAYACETWVDGICIDDVIIQTQATDCSPYIEEGWVCWDTDDDKLYIGDGSSAIEIGAGGGAGNPGGADTQVQYNDGGSFGGDSTFVFIEETTRVGIGTTAPNSQLNIYRNDAEVLVSQLNIEQDDTGDAVMEFLITGQKAYQVGIDNSDGDNFKISEGLDGLATDTLITIVTTGGTGNVGIGVTDPDQKLEVVGSIHMRDSGGSSYLQTANSWGTKWKFAGDANTVEMNESETAWKFDIASGNVTKYRFNASKAGGIVGPIADFNVSGSSIFYGNVGIGDATPDALLEVSASGGASPLLMLSSDDGNDGDRMIVKNDGNVGIGTTTPIGLLDLNRSGTLSAEVIASGIASQSVYHTADTTGMAVLQLQNLNSGIGADMRFMTANDAGNYLAFASPSTGHTGVLFGVTRSTGDFIFGSARDLVIGTIADNKDIKFGTGNDEIVMTIEDGAGANALNIVSGGNVGIGVTDPSRELEVAGEIVALSVSATDGTFANIGRLTPGDATFTVGTFTGGGASEFGAAEFSSIDTPKIGFTTPGDASFNVVTLHGASPARIDGVDFDSTTPGFLLNSYGTSGGDRTYGSNIWLHNGSVQLNIDPTPTDTVDDGLSGLTINSDGKVGISDATAEAMLEVSANGGATDLFMLSSDDANDGDKFIVLNSGNVGIGTIAPLTKLHINQSQSDQPAIDALNMITSFTGGRARFAYWDPDNSDVKVAFGSAWGTASDFAVHAKTAGNFTEATQRLVVRNDGDIEIPADSQELQFGAEQDASISYDGTDLVINPRAVGEGELTISGGVSAVDATFSGRVGIGVSAPEHKLHVAGTLTATDATFTSPAATETPMTIVGAASQTGDLLRILNDSGDTLFEVVNSGNVNNISGIRTTAVEYGAGFGVHQYGDNVPEHINQAGWYDHAGGASGSQQFNKTSGDAFTQADADSGNFLLFTSGEHISAMCEIKSYIDATTVLVDGMGWDQDINSSGTPGTFLTIKHPIFFSGDGSKHEFSVNSSGEFEIASYDFTGSKVAEVELDAAGDNIDALYVKAEANGNNIVTSAEFHYHSGALAAGEVGGGIFVTMDDTEATAADATTVMGAIALSTTDGSSATKRGLVVLPGFDEALTIQGSPAIDPAFGYEVSGGGVTETDRVNGGAGDGNAFLVAGNDLEIFDADDDYILIGSATEFENIQVILATESSKDIEPDFFYSKAGGGWTALAIQSDGTDGFKSSGNIIFADPGDWSKDDESMDGTAITDAFYVAIQRTRGAVIATLPTEDYFKTYASQNTGMVIDGGGFIQPRSAADGSAPNNSIYYSSTQSKLVYKDGSSTVHDLY